VKISRVISTGLSGLIGETSVTSVVPDAEKREHSCPLEEYVRRSTGEVWKSHGFISAGLSGLVGETGSRQFCLTPKNGNISVL